MTNKAQIIEMAVWSYGLKATEQEIAFAMAVADHALEEAAKHFEAQPHVEHFGREIGDAIRAMKRKP